MNSEKGMTNTLRKSKTFCDYRISPNKQPPSNKIDLQLPIRLARDTPLVVYMQLQARCQLLENLVFVTLIVAPLSEGFLLSALWRIIEEKRNVVSSYHILGPYDIRTKIDSANMWEVMRG